MRKDGCCSVAASFGLSALLVAGCTSDPSTAPVAPVNHAQMAAGGVLRVDWARDGSRGDLSIRRMTEFDAGTPPEPRCSRDAGGAHPLYFDLNWRAVEDGARIRGPRISMRTDLDQVVTVVEADGRCAAMSDYPLGALHGESGEQVVRQLVAAGRPSGPPPTSLKVVVDGRSVVLPLIPACGPEGQPPPSSCTSDPLEYSEGAPFSVGLHL